jgi:hypothetical protein
MLYVKLFVLLLLLLLLLSVCNNLCNASTLRNINELLCLFSLCVGQQIFSSLHPPHPRPLRRRYLNFIVSHFGGFKKYDSYVQDRDSCV